MSRGAFGDEATKLARPAKGDILSALGSLKPTIYAKDGQELHGLSLTARRPDYVLTHHKTRPLSRVFCAWKKT